MQVLPQLTAGVSQMLDTLVDLISDGPSLLVGAVRQVIQEAARLVQATVAPLVDSTIEGLVRALVASPGAVVQTIKSAALSMAAQAAASVRAAAAELKAVARAALDEAVHNATGRALAGASALVDAVEALEAALTGHIEAGTAVLMEALARAGTEALYKRIIGSMQNASACALAPIQTALDVAWDLRSLAAEIRDDLRAHFPYTPQTLLDAAVDAAPTVLARARQELEAALLAADWGGMAVGAVRRLISAHHRRRLMAVDSSHIPQYILQTVRSVGPHVKRSVVDAVKAELATVLQASGVPGSDAMGLAAKVGKLAAGNVTDAELDGLTEEIATLLENAAPQFFETLLRSGAASSADGPAGGLAREVGTAIADGVEALTGVGTARVLGDVQAAVQDGIVAPVRSAVLDPVKDLMDDVLGKAEAGLLRVFDELCALGAAVVTPLLNGLAHMPNPVTIIKPALEVCPCGPGPPFLPLPLWGAVLR